MCVQNIYLINSFGTAPVSASQSAGITPNPILAAVQRRPDAATCPWAHSSRGLQGRPRLTLIKRCMRGSSPYNNSSSPPMLGGPMNEATLTLTLGRGAAGDARGAHDSSARISPAASPATCRSSAPTATHKNLLRCSSRRARAGPLLARPPYPIINICIRAVVASAPFGTVL